MSETLPPPETLGEGKWLRLLRRGRWEYAERTHGEGLAVVIIAVTPADELLFVEQYRAALDARVIELPAGLVGDQDASDTLEAAARRELVEETGWEPGEVEVLTIGPTTAGMSSERAALVRARALVKVGDGGGVEHEDIVVHAVPRATAARWLARKRAEGLEVDLKAWSALWLAGHGMDGAALG